MVLGGTPPPGRGIPGPANPAQDTRHKQRRFATGFRYSGGMFSAQGRPRLSTQTTDPRSSGEIPAQAAARATVAPRAGGCSCAAPAPVDAMATIAMAAARQAHLCTIGGASIGFSGVACHQVWRVHADVKCTFQVSWPSSSRLLSDTPRDCSWFTWGAHPGVTDYEGEMSPSFEAIATAAERGSSAFAEAVSTARPCRIIVIHAAHHGAPN